MFKSAIAKKPQMGQCIREIIDAWVRSYNPTDEEKKADVNVEKRNDPPRVFHQLAPVLPKIAHNEPVGQSSPHDEGQDDKVNEGKLLTHQSSASRCLGSG